MILVACVDQTGGMSFHNRRQSRDREVVRRILADADGSRLWLSQRSCPLFAPLGGGQVHAAEDFLLRAGAGEYAFAEALAALPDGLEAVVLYRWDKRYPADQWFPADLGALGWRLARRETFPGYSHKTIEKETYIR